MKKCTQQQAKIISNIIVGVVSHEKNIHDNHTLPDVLNHIEASHGESVCDREYQGKTQFNETKIVSQKNPLRRDNRYQRDKKRRQCKHRAAIEPIIGHLKSGYRLSRNFIKGGKKPVRDMENNKEYPLWPG